MACPQRNVAAFSCCTKEIFVIRVTSSRTLENDLLQNRVDLAFINDLSAEKRKLILTLGFIEF